MPELKNSTGRYNNSRERQLRAKLPKFIYILTGITVTLPILFYLNTQSSNIVKAVSTIGTSGSASPTSDLEQRKVVRSSNGTIVAFYYDSAQGTVFRTSTDNAASWSSATVVGSFGDFSVAIDTNDHIYVSYASANTLYAIKLTYSGGSWSVGSANLIEGSTTCDAGVSDGFEFTKPTIIINSSGKIWVNSIRFRRLANPDCESIQADTVRTFSATIVDSWTPNSSMITNDNYSDGAPLIAIGDALWMTLPSGDTNGGIWRDATSSGTWTKITASTAVNTSVSLTSAGSDQLDLFYENGSNVIVYRKYTISTTTLGSEVTISSVASDFPGTISANTSNGNLWAFYESFVSGDTYNVVYKQFNGSTWDSSATNITTDNPSNDVTNFFINSVVSNSNSIPLIWTVGSTPTYTVKGHALVFQSAPASPTLIYPGSNATGVAPQPQFQLRTTDADNDYLRYKIEVCSTSNCSSVVRTIDQTSSQTGWLGQDQQSGTAYTGNSVITSSTIAKHNYQIPPLSPNTQYWWRAYAIDPGGTNTFSSASGIFSFTTAEGGAVVIPGGITIQGGTQIH